MNKHLNPEDIREAYGLTNSTVIGFLTKIQFGKGFEYYETLKKQIKKELTEEDYSRACKCLEDISNNGDGRWKDRRG